MARDAEPEPKAKGPKSPQFKFLPLGNQDGMKVMTSVAIKNKEKDDDNNNDKYNKNWNDI